MFTVKKFKECESDLTLEFKNISCLRLSAKFYEFWRVFWRFKNISCLRLSIMDLSYFNIKGRFKNISCLRLSGKFIK